MTRPRTLPLTVASTLVAALATQPATAQPRATQSTGLQQAPTTTGAPQPDGVDWLDPDAAFNAGLAAARAERLGEAILAFERAHRLAPGDREIEDSLQAAHREARRLRAERFAEGMLVEGESRSLHWWRMFGAWPVSRSAAALLGGVWTAGLALALSLHVARGWRTDLLRAVAAIGVAVALLGAALWAGRVGTEARVAPAVVLQEAPLSRVAPDELARATRHPGLFAGAIVLTRQARGAWLEVELPDGERVWIARDAVEPIRR